MRLAGTAVLLHLSNPLSQLLDAGFIEAAVLRHFQPLFDPEFLDILAASYPRERTGPGRHGRRQWRTQRHAPDGATGRTGDRRAGTPCASLRMTPIQQGEVTCEV